jgi:hypothetical protein
MMIVAKNLLQKITLAATLAIAVTLIHFAFSKVKRPVVLSIDPDNNSENVSEITAVSTVVLRLPNGKVDSATIKQHVFLSEAKSGTIIPSQLYVTGGGTGIKLVPAGSLKLNTTYKFTISNAVKDLSGASFVNYTSKFTKVTIPTAHLEGVGFDKINLTNTTGQHSSLTIGPDGKLYALSVDGSRK